ncbi:MAG: DUF2007 domain-containing protein [Nitrospirae bacterium]|nr:MAG: DUF2007 domain-containing protein [Nitrospirota bacterium]
MRKLVLAKLRECHDEGELCIIKSLLDGNNIEYWIQNEYFGSLYPGISIPFNTRIIWVPEDELVRAQTLLSRFERTDHSREVG